MPIDDSPLGPITRARVAMILSSPLARSGKQLARQSATAKGWDNIEPFNISDSLSSELVHVVANREFRESNRRRTFLHDEHRLRLFHRPGEECRDLAPMIIRSIWPQVSPHRLPRRCICPLNRTKDHFPFPFPGNPAGFS